MTKNKFVFNIDGKKVVKEPKEAFKILEKDYKDLQDCCINMIEDLLEGLKLLEIIKNLMETAKEDIKKDSKKTTATSKKGTKAAKVEKPTKKAVKANPIKKIKKVIKSKRKAK